MWKLFKQHENNYVTEFYRNVGCFTNMRYEKGSSKNNKMKEIMAENTYKRIISAKKWDERKLLHNVYRRKKLVAKKCSSNKEWLRLKKAKKMQDDFDEDNNCFEKEWRKLNMMPPAQWTEVKMKVMKLFGMNLKWGNAGREYFKDLYGKNSNMSKSGIEKTVRNASIQ